jgi:exosortase F-associated protein
MISLFILYVLFNNTKTLFFSVKIYVVSFILLIFLLTLQLQAQLFDGYLVLFYIRRFLIHPVILLVLVPAFYYQQLVTSKI